VGRIVAGESKELVLVELAFARAGLDYRKYVRLDRSLHWCAEVHLLRADPSKAERILGWRHSTGLPTW